PEPYAQLRPDWPVGARVWRHRHDGFTHQRGECPCGSYHDRPPVVVSAPVEDLPELGWHRVGRSWRERRMPKAELRYHAQKSCEWAGVPEDAMAELPLAPVAGPDETGKYLWPTGHIDPRTGELVLPLDGFHDHLDWAKYRYPPGHGKASRLSSH